MPPPVERKPRFSRWAGRIHEYFRAYSSMIEPVRSVEPSSTIIHSAGRMLCAATASMVAPMNSSSSRTGVIMQFAPDTFGRVTTLLDICPLGKLCSTLVELDNERSPFFLTLIAVMERASSAALFCRPYCLEAHFGKGSFIGTL